MTELTKQEAWNNVAKACAEFRGTYQDHAILQESLRLLRPESEEKKETKA